MASAPTIGTRVPEKGFARGLEGFTARPRVAKELQATGIAELDEVLGGGLPRGSLVELCGTSSSGRTGLCLALLAQATRSQQTCAFVDVSDALDPLSLAAAAVDLDRVLWIRCGGEKNNRSLVSGHPAPQGSKDAEQNKPHRRSLSGQPPETAQTGFSWRHPRDQIRGIETSLPSVLKGHSTPTRGFGVGSPSIDTRARCAGEQVERDREESRRGGNARSWSSPRDQDSGYRFTPHRSFSPQTKPWHRLEQALKTTDLLLHSGGWGVVVLDLGSIPWIDSRRIPLSTWFRFQRIVESTSTILVLLGEKPCARACASAVVRCRRRQDRWRRATQAIAGINTLQGFEVEGEVVRSRAQLERFDAVRWQTRGCWIRSA
jgi:recombination protein RecA